ncbi:MAG: hypothetical protein LT070_05170 [Solirubrobacteraceae bacterium]|nr:hypothetical protein [Solirubrobacteraceae bacterium]
MHLSLVTWEVRRLESEHAARPRRCPRCRGSAEWTAVQERRRLQLLGTGVGPVHRRDLVSCRTCGCALPAGWRDASSPPLASPAA